MKDFEIVEERLSKRVNGIPMDLEEANNLLSDTTFIIIENDEKYMLFGIMYETQYIYNTPRAALNAAIECMKDGKY